MVYAQSRICPGQCDSQTPLGFSDTKLKESEKKDKYQHLVREWKTLWNMRVTVISIVISALGTKGLVQGNGGLGNKRTSRDHPNYCIIKISQNIEKSSGNLRRLAVTQTSERNHRLTLV